MFNKNNSSDAREVKDTLIQRFTPKYLKFSSSHYWYNNEVGKNNKKIALISNSITLSITASFFVITTGSVAAAIIPLLLSLIPLIFTGALGVVWFLGGGKEKVLEMLPSYFQEGVVETIETFISETLGMAIGITILDRLITNLVAAIDDGSFEKDMINIKRKLLEMAPMFTQKETQSSKS